MNKVRIVILADIDPDLYQEAKTKGYSDEALLKRIKSGFTVNYRDLRDICLYDYETISVESEPEPEKRPSCGVVAMVIQKGLAHCDACRAEGETR